jgi:hypothetical protein
VVVPDLEDCVPAGVLAVVPLHVDGVLGPQVVDQAELYERKTEWEQETQETEEDCSEVHLQTSHRTEVTNVSRGENKVQGGDVLIPLGLGIIQ